MNFSSKILAVNIILLLTINSYSSDVCDSPDDIDRQFAQQRRLLNHRYAGLAGAGVAIPEPVSSISLNPALIHHYHQYSKKNYTISLGYERDSLFNALILNGGTSFLINNSTTIASTYRFLKNSNTKNKRVNEVTLSVSGTMFEKQGDAQGGVDIGANLRYTNSHWHRRVKKTFNTHEIKYDSIGSEIANNIISAVDTNLVCMKEESRLLLDIGLFQDNIFNNLDLGITFHNLLGFFWSKSNPVKKDTIIEDSSKAIDTVFYYPSSSWDKENGKNHKSYKRMTVGLSYRVPLMNDKINILVPFDLECFGIFNKNEKFKVTFHTGLETWLAGGKIALRFGYARGPYNISGSPENFDIIYQNIFTGGGSLRIKMFSFDLYFTEYRQEWGLSASLTF